MYDDLMDLVRRRPGTVVVTDPAGAYDRLVAALR
jgi:hypothetical protein